MDLLRLVMARQPIGRLRDLPWLIQDREFINVRRRIHGQTRECDDYIRCCIRDGEIFPGAELIYSCNDRFRARAAFLRDEMLFRHFWEVSAEVEDGFWYTISSDHPGIQDAAIKLVKISYDTGIYSEKDVAEVIIAFEDLLEIQWSEQLREEILPLVKIAVSRQLPLRGPSWKVDFLLGFFGLETPTRIGIDASAYLIMGRLAWITQGKSTWDYNRKCEEAINSFRTSRGDARVVEALIGSGYLCPLLGKLKKGNSESAYITKISYMTWFAIKHANHSVLRWLQGNGLIFPAGSGRYVSFPHKDYIPGTVSRRMALRIREIRDNQLLLPLTTVDEYRILAGEIFTAADEQEERRVSCANPAPGSAVKQYFNLELDHCSVLYDFDFAQRYSADSYNLATVCYRQGKWRKMDLRLRK